MANTLVVDDRGRMTRAKIKVVAELLKVTKKDNYGGTTVAVTLCGRLHVAAPRLHVLEEECGRDAGKTSCRTKHTKEEVYHGQEISSTRSWWRPITVKGIFVARIPFRKFFAVEPRCR